MDLDGNVATSIKAKKAFICRSIFPKPPISLRLEPLVLPGIAYIGVTKVKIAHVLISQSAIKAPWPDKINFRILHMIWDWDKVQIINMVQQTIRLGHHPKEWMKAKEILFEKYKKRDFGLV